MTDIDNDPRMIRLWEFKAEADRLDAASSRLGVAQLATGVVAVAGGWAWAVTDWWWPLLAAVPWAVVVCRQVVALAACHRHLSAWGREIEAARAELLTDEGRAP